MSRGSSETTRATPAGPDRRPGEVWWRQAGPEHEEGGAADGATRGMGNGVLAVRGGWKPRAGALDTVGVSLPCLGAVAG